MNYLSNKYVDKTIIRLSITSTNYLLNFIEWWTLNYFISTQKDRIEDKHKFHIDISHASKIIRNIFPIIQNFLLIELMVKLLVYSPHLLFMFFMFAENTFAKVLAIYSKLLWLHRDEYNTHITEITGVVGKCHKKKLDHRQSRDGIHSSFNMLCIAYMKGSKIKLKYPLVKTPK